MNLLAEHRGGDQFTLHIHCSRREALRIADKIADMMPKPRDPAQAWASARFTTRAELRRIAEKTK